WCGPCKASFPGMQRAQDQLADRDDVAFLFIDTWENVKNKEENAAKFIEKNEYTFNVLMDNDSKVVSEFKVEGIPTKFIIGKDNRIKFKSVGYSGNDEELVNEIKMMIEIAGADGASMASGAP
ncbi:MAG: TlpA disulfide reductase family protein, partial [Bacteroidota bacterium]